MLSSNTRGRLMVKLALATSQISQGIGDEANTSTVSSSPCPTLDMGLSSILDD